MRKKVQTNNTCNNVHRSTFFLFLEKFRQIKYICLMILRNDLTIYSVKNEEISPKKYFVKSPHYLQKRYFHEIFVKSVKAYCTMQKFRESNGFFLLKKKLLKS